MSVERADRTASSNSDLTARIARLADGAGVVLDSRQLGQLVTYLDLLRHWNATINLTSLDLEDLPFATLERLILEPLVAATLVTTDRGPWYDLGTGGGSPALPIKVALPSLALTMVESRGRKVAFLREAVRHMGLSEAEVCAARIDELKDQLAKESVELFTIRAVRVDPNIVGTIQYLLAPSGEVVLFGRGVEDLRAARFTMVRSKGFVSLLRPDVPRGTIVG